MKRTAILALVLTLSVGSAVGASAAPKKPAKAKPVSSTLYFHGTQSLGEVQNQTEDFAVMDATKPTGASAKSSGVTNYTAGPNTNCAGNSLFPVWVGAIDGTPTGDATVDLFLQNAGAGDIEVRLFADVFEQACNEAYVPPLGSATVAIASGQQNAKVVLKNINKKLKPYTSLMVQVSPAASLTPPFVSRVQYDATSAMSSLTFSCLPKKGKKAC